MQVQNVMTKKVVCIDVKTPLFKIIQLMEKYNISSLPVTNEQKQLVGIVRERDLLSHDHNLHLPSYIQFLEALPKQGKAEKEIKSDLKMMIDLPAQVLMEREIAVVKPTTDIRVVAAILTEKDISSVPVINNKRQVVGIICRFDLLKLIKQPKPVKTLRHPQTSGTNYNYQILKL